MRSDYVLPILIHEIELRIELVKGGDVVLVDLSLDVTGSGKDDFNQHLHHIRVDCDLVDQSANDSIHIATILKLLGKRETLILHLILPSKIHL